MLEDSHWADEATLDVVTVLARRIGSLPVLLVLTSRDGEARPGHPVHAAISATRPGDSTFIALAPLSESAVASLATPCTPRPGGNPYYVTELLASRTAADLPPSVATAVQGVRPASTRARGASWRCALGVRGANCSGQERS